MMGCDVPDPTADGGFDCSDAAKGSSLIRDSSRLFRGWSGERLCCSLPAFLPVFQKRPFKAGPGGLQSGGTARWTE